MKKETLALRVSSQLAADLKNLEQSTGLSLDAILARAIALYKLEEESQAKEQWLPVVGYEGRYSVSSLGKVRSEKRSSANGPSRFRILAERIMRPSQRPDGYCYVDLCKEGKKKTFLVHKLVANAFLGPAPVGMFVLHKSLGRECNAAANLCYGTLSANDALMAASDAMP